ncbi:ABC transporter substrate-binding protein [Streptomyces sp. NBS 14/10]|uniref:ABC transporter substrate-binding protein n=1 Tax=Streptomyces sp. NBS 14/10 TaxID=1945643 RepID=UPI000B7FA2CC|nr:ABC transporter substrate-binding protein [Streptomyces sp. NBS 14/10]KAK1185229.1 ABC transporter substrate-binding protein [Streptomyces sp. NBS 14/10]
MPRRTRRRPVAAALVTAILLAPLAACGGNADAKGSGSAVTLSVGDTGWARYQAVLEFAGLDKTPYKVKWSVFAGGDLQLQAVRAGALDVAQSSEIPPVFAVADGKANFKVVAVQRANTLLQEVVTPKGSDVHSIAQLKGKKVGYVKNTTAHYFLYQLLRRAGLKWTDIKAAPLAPSDGLAALKGGSIDAFASYGNSIITAHQQGATTIGSGKDILSGNFLWEASDKTIADRAKREAVADLLARIDKAYTYIRDGHEKEFAKVFAAATHQPLDQALQQVEDGEKQRPTTLHPTGRKATTSQQQVADAFEEVGALPGPVDVADFWSDDLGPALRKALAS